MEDLSKLRYVVGKGADRKLKRNIPGPLQKLAGATAFIERVPTLSAIELKQRANLFAVRTDVELARLKGMVAKPGSNYAALTSIQLSETRARQIVLVYFMDRLSTVRGNAEHLVAPDNPRRTELIAEAGVDYAAALNEAAGEFTYADPHALKLLEQHGVISADQHAQLMLSGWPEALDAHTRFQLMCRLLEQAKLELARIRLKALESGSMPAVDDDYFVPAARGLIAEPEKAHTVNIGALAAAFRKEMQGNVSRSRFDQFAIPIRALEEHFGSEFLAQDVTREECRKLIEALVAIPTHVTQRYPVT